MSEITEVTAIGKVEPKQPGGCMEVTPTGYYLEDYYGWDERESLTPDELG